MTIAACYLSSEAVVLGADSTTTYLGGGTTRHYNFAQKIFEVGNPSTIGIVTWGLGSLPRLSFRAVIAQFAEHLRTSKKLPDMQAVAEAWAEFFWEPYSKAMAADEDIAVLKLLMTKPERTPEEDNLASDIRNNTTTGFCIGGNLPQNLTPAAFEVVFDPLSERPPVPVPLSVGEPKFWGVPSFFERTVYGIDWRLYADIVASPIWQQGGGKPEDLTALVAKRAVVLRHLLPIREAIDFVFSSIYTTIKSIKFSGLAPTCGGPIEIAVITADRPFRWVRHKRLDAAIAEVEIGNE